jgi:hypothetical protein
VAGFFQGLSGLTVTAFVQPPSLWSRFIWAVAEIFGLLPSSYLAALTDLGLIEKAELFIRLGEQAKAQKVLDAASRRVIDEPRVLAQLGNLELRNGNKDVARRVQLRAAQAYLQRGMVDEATHVLQQILAVARDCLEARLALGQIAEGRYGHEEAVAHYLEAVKVLTARQEWDGVQELLERVRQLQRVKSVLEGDTQMAPRQLGPGQAQPLETLADASVTLIDMESPVRRPAVSSEAPTMRGRELAQQLAALESETVADAPSPLYRGPRTPRAPSTVIVEPDLLEPPELSFPDTTDPTIPPPAPASRAPQPQHSPLPPRSPLPYANEAPTPLPPALAATAVSAPDAPSPTSPMRIPSTFVRAAPPDARTMPAEPRPPAPAPVPSVTALDPLDNSREAQLKAPTDIVFREQLPPELLIKIDTAVDFRPGRVMASPGPAPASPGVSQATTQVHDAMPIAASPQPAIIRERRNNSVWDRAIVQGPKESITLNVGPEPDRPPEPSVLRRATTGISSVLDSFLNGMGKDGGGSKS